LVISFCVVSLTLKESLFLICFYLVQRPFHRAGASEFQKKLSFGLPHAADRKVLSFSSALPYPSEVHGDAIRDDANPIGRAQKGGTSMAKALNQTVQIQGWIDRLQRGDESARKELLNCACERLTRLTRKMLKSYARLKRWEETDDVLQNALMRLYRSLEEVRPATAADFFRLAALNIRRELLDLAKHYYGPRGLGANYVSRPEGPASGRSSQDFQPPDSADDPSRLAAWTEFHTKVGKLPPEELEVFDLLWYQELSQAEAAALLNVSERTIKRRWQAARLRLHQVLQGQLPES
jgi:RNA polymerase sigma-70 factor (ECF subfamily)